MTPEPFMVIDASTPRAEVFRKIAGMLLHYENETAGGLNIFEHGFIVGMIFAKSQTSCLQCHEDLRTAFEAVDAIKAELKIMESEKPC